MAPWNPAYMTEVLAALGKRGESLFVPGDTGYHSAKAIYNSVPQNYPDFVYECQSVSDVVRLGRTAVNLSLPIAIKSGGYSMEGFSTCTGACIQGATQEDIILLPKSSSKRSKIKWETSFSIFGNSVSQVTFDL